jgi:hypothetical protein
VPTIWIPPPIFGSLAIDRPRTFAAIAGRSLIRSEGRFRENRARATCAINYSRKPLPTQAVPGHVTKRVRYLQAIDEVTGKSEQVRAEIDGLPGSRPFRAIADFVKIDALAIVDASTLKDEAAHHGTRQGKPNRAHILEWPD